MEGLLLSALLLLGFLGGVSGELCRAWKYGVDPLVGAFQCPERLDTSDAQFCCGTCIAPYCCSSGEARLDQTRCAVAVSYKAEDGTKLPDPQPTSPGHDENIWMVFWFYMGMVTLLIIGVFCICCSTEMLERLSSCWRTPQPEPDDQTRLVRREEPVDPAPDPAPSHAFMDPAFAWQVRRAVEEALEAQRGPRPLQTIPSTAHPTPSLDSDGSAESTV